MAIYHYKTFEIYMVQKLYKRKVETKKPKVEKEPELEFIG